MNKYLTGKPYKGWRFPQEVNYTDAGTYYLDEHSGDYRNYWVTRQRYDIDRAMPPEEPTGYPGYVYVLKSVTGWYKLGRTTIPLSRFSHYSGPSRIAQVLLLRKVKNIRTAELDLKEFMIENGFKRSDTSEWYLPEAPPQTVHFNAFYCHWRDLPSNLGNLVKPGWRYSYKSLKQLLETATISGA